MEQAVALTLSSAKRWQFPIDLEQYDRHPELTESEKEALTCFVKHFTGRMCSWPTPRELAAQRQEETRVIPIKNVRRTRSKQEES